MRRFMTQQDVKHPHLFRVGHMQFGSRKHPFITSTYDAADASYPYRVVFSDCDDADISAGELTQAEEEATATASLALMTPHRRRVRVLDLCSGTKSVARALRFFMPYAKVVTVDMDEQFFPTITADVRTWDALASFPPGYFDIVWASPPCTEYSFAKTTAQRDLETADTIVTACRHIIDVLRPKAWFIENPRGLLATRSCMQDIEDLRHELTYCMYGCDYRKDTHIWTNVPVVLDKCRRDNPCPHMQQLGYHPRVAQNGSSQGRPGVTRAELYTVPQRLLIKLFKAALRVKEDSKPQKK